MTAKEKEIWDKAFKVATAACREHVKFAGKREYASKVADAFIQSINKAKRITEKAM